MSDFFLDLQVPSLLASGTWRMNTPFLLAPPPLLPQGEDHECYALCHPLNGMLEGALSWNVMPSSEFEGDGALSPVVGEHRGKEWFVELSRLNLFCYLLFISNYLLNRCRNCRPQPYFPPTFLTTWVDQTFYRTELGEMQSGFSPRNVVVAVYLRTAFYIQRHVIEAWEYMRCDPSLISSSSACFWFCYTIVFQAAFV